MRPYGMTKLEHQDDDAKGSSSNGRATRVYNVPGKGGETRAYRSLRRGKKARTRRIHKRRARHLGKADIHSSLTL